jgi:cell division protein FtsB
MRGILRTTMTRRRKKRSSPQSTFFKKVKERSIGKKRIIKKVLLFLAFAFLVYRFFAGPYGFVQIHSLWKEKKNLEKQSKMLDAQIVDLEIEKNRLTDDEFYMEKQARERLGMVKEGEKVYKIIHQDKLRPAEEGKSDQPTPPDSLSP